MEWAILKSLAVPAEEAAQKLLELARHDGDEVARVLLGRGVCGWIVHTNPAYAQFPESLREIVQKGAQREFMVCAQRKAAMMSLDALAAEQECAMIAVKGAANALLYYEKESTRPSLDSDLIMTPDAIARCFNDRIALPAEDAPREQWFQTPEFRIAGYPVEAHAFFLASARWGHCADLEPTTVPLRGFSQLRGPDATTAFTLSLLHFMHHGGGFFFDLLDMVQIAKQDGFDIAAAAAVWKENDLVDLVLPGLAVVEALTPLVSEVLWDELWDTLRRRKRFECAISLRFLASARFNRMRADWFRSRIVSPAFSRRLFGRVAGSKEFTKQRTGLEPGSPRFWLHHILVLPLQRLVFFWK